MFWELVLRCRTIIWACMALTTPLGEFVTFEYHFFNNTFNTFILLLPAGEGIKSRTVIIPR
jgi:hypothetical protein